MAVEWQSRDFLTDWTGLFNRRQSVDVPPSYARTARNVDFFGSAIGKRQGTQIVNGWGTLVTGAWTLVGTTADGPVVDRTGFKLGDTVKFVTPELGVIGSGTVNGLYQIGAVHHVQLIGFTGTLPPVNAGAVARRDLGGRVDGLYHAVFRSGKEMLLASANGILWDVWGLPLTSGASYQATPVAQLLPQTTVATTWADTLNGSFAATDTLVAVNHSTGGQTAPNSSAAAPDIIRIVHAGTTIYEGTIASFHVGPTLTLTAPAASIPQAGDQVIFFPHRTAADTRFTMLNNRVYVTSAAGLNPAVSGGGLQTTQRTPPTVIDEDIPGGTPGTVYERRMGIRAPTTVASVTVTGAGLLTGTYSWRYTYVNTKNGQESEGSPVVPYILPLANQQAVVQVYRSPDPQVDQIKLYRTLGDQSGAWYLVASAPNTTASITDNVDDTALGALLKTFSNEPPPDTVTFLAVWTQAGALIGIDSGPISEGGEVVAWSDAPDVVNSVYKVESWPINNTLFVNRDDGDKLRSLGAFYDSVVVWKGRSMHRIVGAPPDIIVQPISFRDDQTGVGIWSAKGFIMDVDVAIFASDDGFYQVSRYEGVQQGFTSSRISRSIDQEWIGRTGVRHSMTDESHQKFHMIYHRLKHRLQAFACVDGFEDPVEMFVYQLEGTVEGMPHGWSEWSVPVDYYAALSDTPLNNFVSASCVVHFKNGQEAAYYGCGPHGLVVQADVGAGEWNCLPVTFEYETVWFSAGGAGTVTRGRVCDYVLQATNGQPALQLLVGQDFQKLDAYDLPPLAVHTTPFNLNTLFLSLAQYHSLGTYERSATGLFLINDFTFWFQRLPVGVTDRIALAYPSLTGPPS